MLAELLAAPLPPSLPAPGRARARIGGAAVVADVLRSLGASFDGVAAQAGLSPTALADPAHPTSVGRLGRLLSVCSEATGCPHFGLLVGGRAAARVSTHAPCAARAAPNVGALLVGLLSLLPEFSDLVRTPKATSGICAIGCAGIDSRVQGREHIADAVLAFANGILRAACGPHWRPVCVSLERCRPIDVLPYLVEFGAQLGFGEGEAALTLERRWLTNPPSHSEIARRVRLPRAAPNPALAAPLGRRAFPDSVRQILRVWQGGLTAESAAALFGLPPRDFHRLLARSHTGFGRLLDEARYERARRFLLETEEPVEEVARLLGYPSEAEFVRAFRQWSGVAPAKWRACEERAMRLRADIRALRGGKGSTP